MNNKKMLIRSANQNDLAAIQGLFIETIKIVCSNDYSHKQIAVWISSIENTKRWANKLIKQYFLVAEINDRIVGFASLEKDEYLDFLYVHKDWQRNGIADQLYSKIEARAIIKGSILLTANVSITAKAFFEKKGFNKIAKQINTIKGVELVNYKMTKDLRG